MAAAPPKDVASVRHRPRGTRVGTDAGTVGVVDQPPGYDRPGCPPFLAVDDIPAAARGAVPARAAEPADGAPLAHLPPAPRLRDHTGDLVLPE